MPVKILIKRRYLPDKDQEMLGLLRRLRTLAVQQEGYISGETLRRVDNPEELLVISTWHSLEDWRRWFDSPTRRELQSQIDTLLGRETLYEIYRYGSAD